MEKLHDVVRRQVSRISGNPKENGEADVSDRPRSSRSAADALITDDRRITIAKLCEDLQLSHGYA